MWMSSIVISSSSMGAPSPVGDDAGANRLVAGTAIFHANETVSTAMDRLRASVQQTQASLQPLA